MSDRKKTESELIDQFYEKLEKEKSELKARKIEISEYDRQEILSVGDEMVKLLDRYDEYDCDVECAVKNWMFVTHNLR